MSCYDPHGHRAVSGNDWIPFTIIAVLTLVGAGAVIGIHVGWVPSVVRPGSSLPTFGWIAIGIAAVIALLNFYLSFVRYRIHRFRGGSADACRFVSGIPGLGSVALLAGALLIPSSWSALGVIAVIALLDTAGLPWFFLALGIDALKK